jgi:hydrogenase nickel incorporation protein HypA/HybF
MHELSIAMSIVEMAEEESAARGEAHIDAIHLKLGALAGVVKGALLSAWELACDGTKLAGSRLVIEEVPILAYCPTCRGPRTLTSMQWFACPECGSPVSEILEGREMQVVALEIRE